MKVLLAEDDLDQLAVRCMLLERSGFAALGASDDVSALSLAKIEKPECAVVDLRLPTEERGLRLICALKEIDPLIRIIVLTGSNAEHVVQRPEAKLVDEIVVKGASSARLVEKLKLLASRATAL